MGGPTCRAESRRRWGLGPARWPCQKGHGIAGEPAIAKRLEDMLALGEETRGEAAQPSGMAEVGLRDCSRCVAWCARYPRRGRASL